MKRFIALERFHWSALMGFMVFTRETIIECASMDLAEMLSSVKFETEVPRGILLTRTVEEA